MSLIRWDSTNELGSLQSEVNRLFSSFFDPTLNTVRRHGHEKWLPAVDLVEQEDQYLLHADLPGLSEEDVQVQLENGLLTISGERKHQNERQEGGYYRLERSFGSFTRSLQLPDGVDPQHVKAHFDKGVLEVTIPKPVEQQTQRVAIEVKPGKS